MNRKLILQLIVCITTFLFIFTAILPIVHSVPPITRNILTVDSSGDGDFTNIKDAINSAAPTDIIKIEQGVYRENNLEINKKLSIIGDDPDTVIIDCGGESGFVLSSTYVDIDNIQITNSGEYAIYVTPESDSCTISNSVIIKDAGGIGVWIRASSIEISDCDFIGYDKTAIAIKLREHDNIISDCNIQGFDVGVLALLNTHDNKIRNCNLLDNENAVDIRLNSEDNLITNCNIYGNKRGIYIWQNSNNNLIYLNNFWKNDVDATDEENNKWNNGAEGNYWAHYTGNDINGDGIGDTPYIISGENKDEFPVMAMMFPDIVSVPINVRQETTVSDNTPSFIWAPSVYIEGIKGYYVKIDSNSEIFIGDTTSWTSTSPISNGVHTFYVRAESKDEQASNYASTKFAIDTTLTDSDGDSWTDEEEQRYGTDPNDPDNYPLDTDEDYIPDSADTDDDNDGYTDEMEMSYRTNQKDSTDYPTDTDNDGVPNDDSPDGKYTGDIDDDDDGLSDKQEIQLGSIPKKGSDVNKLYIKGKPYYLVDLSQNGFYDVFYNPTSETTFPVEKTDESYLIDYNGDGTWDHSYSILDGSVSTYPEEQKMPSLEMILFLIIAILVIILIIVFYYIKNRSKIMKQRKTGKSAGLPSTRKTPEYRIVEKDTKTTADKIGHIPLTEQPDITAYKIHTEQPLQTKEQVKQFISEDRQEIVSTKKKQGNQKNIQDLESKVDKLLSDLKYKND